MKCIPSVATGRNPTVGLFSSNPLSSSVNVDIHMRAKRGSQRRGVGIRECQLKDDCDNIPSYIYILYRAVIIYIIYIYMTKSV